MNARTVHAMALKTADINEFSEFSDPRTVPAYSIPQAAHYLNIPIATVRSWLLGTSYTAADGHKERFEHVINPPHPDTSLMSFFNLVECHVLRAMRTQHGIDLRVIRQALNYVKQTFGWETPLIKQEFQTDGAALFVEHLSKIVEVSAGGQLAMRTVMDAHLKRIEWKESLAARLYPFTRNSCDDSPRTVFIDPRFCFGRPLLRASYIATAVVAERYKAGDSVKALATDYGCSPDDIEEAVRCELRVQAAA